MTVETRAMPKRATAGGIFRETVNMGEIAAIFMHCSRKSGRAIDFREASI